MRTLVLLALALPLFAQSYPKHNFTAGVGGAMPGSDLEGQFSNRPDVSFGYGYRIHENFQLDAGLDVVFGAAGVRDFLETDLGYLRIRDFEYLLPLGGRIILPVSDGRVLFSVGGGAAYMRYSERLKQVSDYYQYECPYCGSRSGWGYYTLVGGSVALDRSQRFRVGVTSRLYRGNTDGDAIGYIPALRTHDTWLNVAGEFTVSF